MKRPGITNLLAQISIFALDSFLVIVSFALAYLLRQFIANYISLPSLYLDLDEFLLKNWWLMLIYMIILMYEGIYQQNRTFWEEWRVIIQSLIIATGISFSFVAIAKLNPFVSRFILMLVPIILVILLPISKYFFKKLLYIIGLWRQPILEVRINSTKSLKEPLAINKYLGEEIIKSLNVKIKDRDDVFKVFKKIKKELEVNNYAGILFSVKNFGDPNISLLLEKVYFIISRLLVVPSFIGFDVSRSNIYHLMYENLFIFDIKKGLNKRYNAVLKRAIDIIVGILILVLLWPFILLVSILIYIADGAPAFYSHERFGRNGKIFKFYKFRSMYKDNDKMLEDYLNKHPDMKAMWETYQKLPLDKDPRVIKGVGYWIRKLNLDELPQVFNLIKGDISLVGPRPYMPRERERMEDYFDRIVAVKPGITGLWQVSGRNERTFEERMQIDIWYIQNWSLWLDISIVLKTIIVLLRR